MALNPPVSLAGQPFRLENEYILAERPGMAVEVEAPNMSKLSAKGRVFLTTARLVFVNADFRTAAFKSLDLPVAHLSQIDFKQPVFGSNYLQFRCRPFLNLLPATVLVRLYFTEGGAEKFLKMFEQVGRQVQEQLRAGRVDDVLRQQWSNGAFAQRAFYDPQDPTVVVTQQPPVFSGEGQFVGTNIYSQPAQPSPAPPPPSTDYPAAPPNDYRVQPAPGTPGGFYPVFEGGQPAPANAHPRAYNPNVITPAPDAGLYYGFFGPPLVRN